MYLQVNPNEAIQVVALLTDTTDGSTYFVQSVMRDTKNGTVLGTVKLTVDPSNSRRFTGQLTAPGAVGASAYYIDITTTWYTNSGYSAKAANVPEMFVPYIVAYRWSYAMGSGGGDQGAVANFDWPKLQQVLGGHMGAVRKYVKDELAVIAKPTPALDVTALNATVEATIKGHFKQERLVQKSIARKRKQLDDKRKQKVADDAAAAVVAKKKQATTDALKSVKSPLVMDEKYRDLHSALYDRPGKGNGRAPSEGVKPLHHIVKERHSAGRTEGLNEDVHATIVKQGDAIKRAAEYVPQPPAIPQQKKASVGSKRAPSPGIIPHHIRVRNKIIA